MTIEIEANGWAPKVFYDDSGDQNLLISVFFEWTEEGREVIVQTTCLDTQLILSKFNYGFFSFKKVEISKSNQMIVC